MVLDMTSDMECVCLVSFDDVRKTSAYSSLKIVELTGDSARPCPKQWVTFHQSYYFFHLLYSQDTLYTTLFVLREPVLNYFY